MKRVTCLVAAIAAFALAFCLVGCSSDDDSSVSDSSASNSAVDSSVSSSNPDIDLNKTVTTHGITYSVPSNWAEAENDQSSDDHISGDVNYTTDDNSMYASVSYLDPDLYKDAESAFDAQVEMWRDDEAFEYTNMEYSEVESTVVDGASCTIYEYSFDFKVKSSDFDYSHTDGCIAYIMAPGALYEIEVTGNDCVSTVEAILETVKIE